MEKTVAKMKIGEPLVFGSYSSSHNDKSAPIVWLKASKDCDFITRDAIDYICFDAREDGHRNGNANYLLSNILLYLNSDFAAWYVPRHSNDSYPSYHNHVGFLYYFEDYEVASLVEKEGSFIRLPAASDIVDNETKFSLFKQKGVRARASFDYYAHHFLNERSYFPYWLRPENVDFDADPYEPVPFLSRNSKVEYTFPVRNNGLRPVCTINPSLLVKSNEGDDNMFYVVPFETNNNACTDDELMSFLGVNVSN